MSTPAFPVRPPVAARRTRALPFLVCLVALGCDALPAPPGKPDEADRYVQPSEVVDFQALYALHCSGCHGANGTLGPARALHDPLYLSVVPREVLERKIRGGVAGTPMPAFAGSEGGPLTDAQVEAIVDGLGSTWGERVTGPLPRYAAATPGDPKRGRVAFATFCARCHGADGRGGETAGSVVDPAYLGLVSDQGLRTSVIVGRPDLGKPDYRSYVPGRPMTEREIGDVVAWLVAKRPRYPGQPYPEAPARTGAPDAARASAERSGTREPRAPERRT